LTIFVWHFWFDAIPFEFFAFSNFYSEILWFEHTLHRIFFENLKLILDLCEPVLILAFAFKNAYASLFIWLGFALNHLINLKLHLIQHWKIFTDPVLLQVSVELSIDKNRMIEVVLSCIPDLRFFLGE
jgi:hypothetical protein